MPKYTQVRANDRTDLIFRDHIVKLRKRGVWHRFRSWVKLQMFGELRRHSDPVTHPGMEEGPRSDGRSHDRAV
jgi:hypothetical protein